MFSGMRKTRTLSLIHRINEGNIHTVENFFCISTVDSDSERWSDKT